MMLDAVAYFLAHPDEWRAVVAQRKAALALADERERLMKLSPQEFEREMRMREVFAAERVAGLR